MTEGLVVALLAGLCGLCVLVVASVCSTLQKALDRQNRHARRDRDALFERMDKLSSLAHIEAAQRQMERLGAGPFMYNAPERLRMDVAYIERRCLWLDVQILFRTVFSVHARKGAH